MSRAGGFCPFIAGGAGDPLHPLHSYPFVPGLFMTDRLPSGEDRVWDRVPRFYVPNHFVFLEPIVEISLS